MKLTNMISIKGYNAGKEGNMLISLDTQLRVGDCSFISPKGQEKHVECMICTATVDLPEDQNILEELVDDDTPCNKVIVVNKQFLKLSNKKQLALLEIQNAMLEVETPQTNVSRRSYGEIAAIEKYGKIAVRTAIKKERKEAHRSIFKAATGLHRQYKKDVKQEKKLQKAMEVANVVAETVEEETNSSQPAPEPAPAL